METGPRLKVSSDRLEKPGIEPATPGLQGKWLIHYSTAAPQDLVYWKGITVYVISIQSERVY